MTNMSIREFADRLNEIFPVMMKEFARQQIKESLKDRITMPQFLLLNYLAVSGQIKMKDLARFMHVSTAAMTGIVDRLVRDGNCARVPDPEDRRIIRVRLTGRGQNIVRRINAQRRQMVIKVFGKISEKDRQDYLRVLSHIRDVLAREET